MLKTNGRRFIQYITAILYNSNFNGFVSGRIFKGPTKGVCVPGLNCYSCPGALAACPLGSLQTSFSANKPPLYVAGLLLAFGILLGRAVCAFLCPFGLIQELLHKIPSPKVKKSGLTRRLSLLKYGVLLVFVIALPIYFLLRDGVASPAFCKYICPAGTLEAGLPLVALNGTLRDAAGTLFSWKLFVLSVIIVGAVFVYRFFCRFICPLGAIYSAFNRYALFGISVDGGKCVKCAECVKHCKMDTLCVNDRECIRCGECKNVCPHNAVNFSSKIAFRKEA